MAQFERDLSKIEHPFGIDGYWQSWYDSKGHIWSLRTICWAGKQPKEFKSVGLPRYRTEEVQSYVNNAKFIHPHKRYFYHPIKKQAVQLTNETLRRKWLDEEKEKERC